MMSILDFFEYSELNTLFIVCEHEILRVRAELKKVRGRICRTPKDKRLKGVALEIKEATIDDLYRLQDKIEVYMRGIKNTAIR